MNWFERYGIPGAYFLGLMAAWVYVFYPSIILSLDYKMLVASAAITFLPIGYIISIFQQLIYLRCRCLGIHRAAMDKVGARCLGFLDDNLTNDEAILEARSTLLPVLRNEMPLEGARFIRDWIRRRMDVMAINLSLIIATILAVGAALLIPWVYYGCSSQLTNVKGLGVLAAFSVLVIVVMICSWKKLKSQVVEVIAGIYRVYREFG